MKRLHMISALLLLPLISHGQERESQSVIERLIWDDKMLNILLDTRVDFQFKSGDSDAKDLSFHGNTLKLWFTGEVVPGIRYRVRHRLTTPQNLARDGYSGATDHAWVAFDAGKRWTFTAGKQSVQLGTFEYDYNPADIYLSSMVNNDIDSYKVGLNTAYKFAGQVINLQFVNSDNPQFASYKYRNRALAAALLWEGNLFNGVLRTRWGYGVFQHTKTKFYNWITLGTQLNIGDFTTELDWYYGDRNIDYSGTVTVMESEYRYVRDQSVSINFKYDFGRWKPFIKGTWNQRFDKEYNRNAYRNTGIQAAVEFYPFRKELLKDLRFHAMYSYNETDFQGPFHDLSNAGQHYALVGMRWLFKAK